MIIGFPDVEFLIFGHKLTNLLFPHLFVIICHCDSDKSANLEFMENLEEL